MTRPAPSPADAPGSPATAALGPAAPGPEQAPSGSAGPAGSATGNASEAAQVIAALVPTLGAQDQQDLHRLLGHLLAAPSAAAIRHARLGLLITLTGDGLIGCEDYEAARALRAAEGEEWPAASTIARAYGHWWAAARAAAKLADHGTASRVPAAKHPAARRPARGGYRPIDITDAIRHCRRDLGRWPTEWEYLEWATLRRHLARQAGQPPPHLPAAGPIRRLYHQYHAALSAAQQAEAA